MKVIDLLNKIAKGEEVPNKIKYKGTTYEKDNDGDIDFYIGGDYNGTLFLEKLDDTNELNDEIEIIEEEKEIEEIMRIDTRETRDCIIEFQNKINELVRGFNKLNRR